jgi:orotate phosphoribosyltransferase
MNTSIDTDRSELFHLLKTRAFSRGKFILSSGKESDFYLDARLVTLSAPGAYLTARIILDMISKDQPNAIGGPTLGADPMVGAIASLSHQAGRPINTFIIRKTPKAHGKQQQVEGPLLKEGDTVVIIDDVATTGKAFVESIEVLQKMNITVKKAICVIDRGEGAGPALARYNVPLASIFTLAEFLK